MTTILKAGAAKADISPAIGIQIAGDIGRLRPCTGIKDPIYARALVIEQDGKKFCVLTLDLLGIVQLWTDEIRSRAQKMYGLAPEALMIHTTQNHAGPSLGNTDCRDSSTLIPEKYPWLRCGDARYNEPAAVSILTAIGEALKRLTAVTVAAGRAIDGRVGFNRRYVMRDGTSLCQPMECNPKILQVEGPTDPEVGVVTFTAADGRVVSALLHHTAHPCNGFWGNEVMPDWPGAWCQEMEAHFGESCTPLVVNGCCGNITTFNYLDPDQDPKGGDYRQMGRQLAESTKRALKNMTPIEDATMGSATQILEIPWRPIPADVLAAAEQMLRDHPQPFWIDDIRVHWDWLYAVGIVDMADEQKTVFSYPYEIQAVRIGNFVLVALPGEPFVETQLQIKGASPFAFTQFAHMSNSYAGYIPTKRALAGGSYETRIGRGSLLHPDAAEMIESATGKLLKQLAEK